ncbi:MAG: hypothetical protein K0S39_2340, partial [Paenibacillus sp.]|nr:hypothetical protein [Paenibacillus sp.]
SIKGTTGSFIAPSQLLPLTLRIDGSLGLPDFLFTSTPLAFVLPIPFIPTTSLLTLKQNYDALFGYFEPKLRGLGNISSLFSLLSGFKCLILSK